MSLAALDNIVWNCLAGAHAGLACGSGGVLRYRPGFPPLVGFADAAAPDFEALARCSEPGERLYCGGWSGPVPAGWSVEFDSTATQMIWPGTVPPGDALPDATRLGDEHVAAVLDLVLRTQPGPFAQRMTELGEYLGVFEAGRLVAMAGERMAAGTLREISAVCTDPAFQGRGFARRLVATLLQRQLARGQRPFLHVVEDNAPARRLYQRMGFVGCREIAVRVVTRVPAPAPTMGA